MASKYKSPMMFLVALALAGLATFAVFKYLDDREKAMQAALSQQTRLVQVIVPTRNLEIGDPINNRTVSARQIPEEFVPDNALKASQFDAVDGMTVIKPVSYGRPLMRHQVKGLAGVDRFSQLLKKGERAVTIEVSDVDTNSFMLETGDIIDLILVVKEKSTKDKSKEDVTILPILDRVTVLATETHTIADPPMSDGAFIVNGYRTLTVGVDIKDVPLVLSAREKGELSYLLRHPDDDKPLKSGLDYAQVANARTLTVFAGGEADNGLLKARIQNTLPVPRSILDKEGNPRFVRKFSGRNDGAGEDLPSGDDEASENALKEVTLQ